MCSVHYNLSLRVAYDGTNNSLRWLPFFVLINVLLCHVTHQICWDHALCSNIWVMLKLMANSACSYRFHGRHVFVPEFVQLALLPIFIYLAATNDGLYS